MLETKYPDKQFIWWTIPLTQSGQRCTDTLNYLIRKYAVENNKILFDIADMESWDTLNQHRTNANGWEVAFSFYCGEAPPGPSCHPNWTGSILIAKAFWWMMASIAGMQDTIPDQDSVPVISTTAVTSIGMTSALSGGFINSNGGKPVTDRGVVWSMNPAPDITLTSKTSDGSGIGSFSSIITGLTANTTYHIRAYATNTIGTGYGNELTFKTLITGLNYGKENDIKVFTSGKLIKLVSASDITHKKWLIVTDLYGREISRLLFHQKEMIVDLSDRPGGCYIVSLVSGNGIWKKVVIFE